MAAHYAGRFRQVTNPVTARNDLLQLSVPPALVIELKGVPAHSRRIPHHFCFALWLPLQSLAEHSATERARSAQAGRDGGRERVRDGVMVNARPLSLWAVERGEAAAASNKGGTLNGTSATAGWRYGTCLPLSSGEPIAKHNLPFRPPTTQVLRDEKSPTSLRNQERGISGGASQESRLQASMEEVPVKMCIPEGPEQLNSQKRKTLGMPTYLLSNGKRSAIKPFTPPRQVAVSGSGTLARPTSSLQQMAPSGNKLQKTTEFKHPAGLSSWDVGQVSSSGQDLQVPSSSILQYPQVPSPSAMRYPQQQHSPGSYSLASNSSTVRYPHAYSSSEGRYPQQTLQVQHSRASDSSSEMRQTGELPDWRSAPAPEQPLFQTAAGRPVQVSASAMARAHALLGE